MIDSNLLLEDFEGTAVALARKGVERTLLEEARDLMLTRKKLIHQIDLVRAELNAASKQIGMLMAQKDAAGAEKLKGDVAGKKELIADSETALEKTQTELDFIMLRVPNLPSSAAPEGKGEEDNVIRRYVNYNPQDYAGKVFKPHWDVATALDIYDADRAVKISGSGFYVLKGDGCRLLHALIAFARSLNGDTYLEITPPHFVRTETFTATGHLPKFEEDAYRLRDDDLWAIPTAEVPLTSLHRDEILREEDLPLRYMAYTVCFRREAGSAGKDTRGMQRLHEFHKLEALKICAPAQVAVEYDGLLEDAERPLKLLGLPYRVVDLCAADLGFGAARTMDLEVYAPGVDKWLEVSSVGQFSDFQARRGNIRFRRGTGKPEFVHLMNGSALATPRVWAAVVEHGQQPDGSVRIPDALIPFMGKEFIRVRE